MMIDSGWAKVATDITLFSAGAIAAAVAAWLRRDRGRVAQVAALRADLAAQHEALMGRLVRLEVQREAGPTMEQWASQGARILALEQALRSGVSHEDIGRVHARIDKQGEMVSEVRGALARIERGMDMLTQHMLAHGPREGDRHAS